MTEIDKYSYWEHFRYAKELALILPPEHPKRIVLQKTLNNLSKMKLTKEQIQAEYDDLAKRRKRKGKVYTDKELKKLLKID